MRLLHPQQMLSRDNTEWGCCLLSAISSLVNLFLTGNIRNFVCGALFGSTLRGLLKKSGLRPIATWSVYRRLAAKFCSKYACGILATTFRSDQFGVCTSGGCETAVHIARKFVTSSEYVSISVFIIMKVEVKNSFNTFGQGSFSEED